MGLCKSVDSGSWEHTLSGSAFDRHERAVSDRMGFMLHDEPEGTNVDHALRLLAALEHHALPGLLHLSRQLLTFGTTLLDILSATPLGPSVSMTTSRTT